MMRLLLLTGLCLGTISSAFAREEGGEAPLPPPIVQRTDHHDWEVRTHLYFGTERPDYFRGRRRGLPPYVREKSVEQALHEYVTRRLGEFSSGPFTVYLPHIPEGATHRTDPERIELELYLHSEIEPHPYYLRHGAVLAEELIATDIGAVSDTIVNVRLHRWMRTYDVRFHEERAAACPFWSYWPAEIEQFLQPSPYIETRDADVVRLVRSWIGERYWQAPPHLAAKALTGKVLDSVRLNGTAIRKFRVDLPYYLGLEVQGARHALLTGEGTHVDVACAIVATLRLAEIPARTVIGVDSETEELKVWFEYCLHDPVRQENIWVPVDLEDVRAQMHGTRDVTRRWDGFGHFGPIEDRIPLSYHFAPQIGIQNGYPALWSWQPKESSYRRSWPTLFEQVVDHEVLTAPNRGEAESAADY